MKTKYLLSALAIGSAVVACNNEDIIVNESTNTNEVVGAKLLGTGLSMNLGNSEDSESRATATGWEDGDVAGLGWVVVGTPGADQISYEDKLNQVGTVLYSNHFYQYSGDAQAWATKTNIYEGWHFAYFPYAYQAKPSALSFEVNKAVFEGGDYKADMANNAPHISAAAFLSDDNVNASEGTIEEPFAVERVVNVLRPRLSVSSNFTGHEDLKDIEIKNIVVGSTYNAAFYPKIYVNPANLPTNYYLENGKYSKDSTLYQLRGNLYEDRALSTGTERVKDITTTLKAGSFKLDKNQDLRIFLAPTQNSTDIRKDSLFFRVNVAGGHFDVKFKNPAQGEKLTDVQKTNNAAIEKLFALMTTGYKASNDTVYNFKTISTPGGNLNPAQNISMALDLENFTADYLISDSTDWNGAVKLANALKEENPKFTLKEGAKVVFTTSMKVPTKGVTVVGEKTKANSSQLIIAGNLTWEQKIKSGAGVGIHVNKDVELTVEGTLAPQRLYNYGTIIAGEKSTVGNKLYPERFNNMDGRVIIEYGAYVYPNSTDKGVIAYNVPANETAARIKNLIDGGSNMNVAANVNTLMIQDGVVLDLTPIAGGTTAGDRYNNDVTGGTTTYPVLDEVNVELYNGTIKSTEFVNVNNLTIEGENNAVENINVLGKLIIAEGVNTIVSKSVVGAAEIKGGNTTITGAQFNDVTVAKNAELTLVNATINGSLTNNGIVTLNNAKSAIVKNLVNNGVLVSNNDINVETVKLTQGSTTTLKSDDSEFFNKTIWYTNSYEFKNMTLNGTVKNFNAGTLEALYTAATPDANGFRTVELNADVNDGIKLAENSMLILDLKGHTIDLTDVRGLVGSATTQSQVMQILKGSKVTLKNGTIKSNVAKMLIQNYGELTLENMTLEAVEVNGYPSYAISNNNGTVNINGKTNIKAPTAFDVYDYVDGGYTTSATVNVNTTGTVEGDIEIGYSNKNNGTLNTLTLNVQNGTIKGNLKNNGDKTKTNVTVSKTAKVYGTGWPKAI